MSTVVSERIKVAIVDRSGLSLSQLQNWFDDNAPEVKATAVADHFDQLLTHHSFPPDIVVVGSFPAPTDAEVYERVTACLAAGARIVVMNEFGKQNHVQGHAGVFESIPRKTSMREFVATLHRVAKQRVKPSNAAPGRPKLSRAEQQALKLYAAGASTKEVALAMGVHYETAKTFLRRVRVKYNKLHRCVGSREALTTRAREDGLVTAKARVP